MIKQTAKRNTATVTIPEPILGIILFMLFFPLTPDLLPNIKQHPPESSFLPAGIAFLMVCAPNGGFPMVRAGTGLLF